MALHVAHGLALFAFAGAAPATEGLAEEHAAQLRHYFGDGAA
jgi:hypothetical protein